MSINKDGKDAISSDAWIASVGINKAIVEEGGGELGSSQRESTVCHISEIWILKQALRYCLSG